MKQPYIVINLLHSLQMLGHLLDVHLIFLHHGLDELISLLHVSWVFAFQKLS